MSGAISIGWFDPIAFSADTDYLVRKLRKAMPVAHKLWPLQVSSIRQNGRGTGVAYAIVDGHIPIHIDQVGLDDSNGKIFQFVLAAENRPALLTARADERNSIAIEGRSDQFETFGIGAMELHVGMAVHFDITEVWHGVTSLPIPAPSLRVDRAPRAVIIQVAGFEADQIEAAIEKAAELVTLDRPWWDNGRAMLPKRKR